MQLDYKQIGKNLARRRKELRLKQFEVCERAEINDKYHPALKLLALFQAWKSF